MPSISQPFRLAILPRLTSLTDTSVQTNHIQVADDLFPASNKITIGISESAISQYILNPTPKLVFSIPIPSTNVVTACDIAQLEENLEQDKRKLQEIWCYALKAGKNYTLNVVINDADSESILNSSGELNGSKKLRLKDEVVNLKIQNETIVAVLKCGLILTYDYDLKLLHSMDVLYGNVTVVNHFKEKEKTFMFVMCSLEESKVCFKLFELYTQELTSVPIMELSSIILEDFELIKSKICYQSGRLYRLIGDQMLTYSLPHCQLLQKVQIPMVSESQVISMNPVSPNRILLTLDNIIYLLDLMHNSILFQRELTHVKSFQILKSAVINSQIGSNASNNKTIAIGVANKQDSNSTCSLEMINVDVGTGTVKDSLGKSFQIFNQSAKSYALEPLLTNEELSSLNDDERSRQGNNFDFDDIYRQLVKCGKSASSFDDVFLNELKIRREHYTEEDRYICDQEFLSKVVNLIFENFQKEYPKSLTFLLTHPLFPVDCTRKLLSRLSEHPRLFKQAIVTCPNLPLKELLFELFSIQNGELSLDISLRILQDYTTDMIRDEIKKLSKIEIQNFIDFLINSKDTEIVSNGRQLFQLLSLILDSIGLLTLEGSMLARLSEYIDQQVVIAERNTNSWYLLDDRQAPRVGTFASNSFAKVQKEPAPRYSVEYLDI
ncbi:hypothetical protein HG535_0B02150 [Zygotorulaspora mrakii]|uniref:U3 small nucleolar RNA-associated protein 8 n=1 Tax=Zygotorulaspora mrakii TaxID=42260 RepID=A0A7H9AYE5_ZYGMR|nr:uncharacterized protein HG535_0B02150 [Zygotorulaspora mrakii]QLG71177.1 hypothetical protein HG535_0B02150 [Zygotorulaspora mrakii]